MAVIPHLRRDGRIINICSICARRGSPGFAIYSSSKAAVEGFTRAVAAELAPEGHTVNAVEPGPVDTELLQAASENLIESWVAMTPCKRCGTPQDIANVVAFLAESRSGWLTGQTISATGGLAMI